MSGPNSKDKGNKNLEVLMATWSRTKINSIIAATGAAFLMALAQGAQAEGNVENGEKIYKRQRCETCHGQNLEGSAAFPNLTTSTVVPDKAAFINIVTNGKGAMPAMKENKAVMEGMEDLYAFVLSKHK
jgi:mono/diheme cytochrome c family protein